MSVERRLPPQFGIGLRVRVVAGTCTGWIGRISEVSWYPTMNTYGYDLVFEPATSPAPFFVERELEIAY